MIVSAGIAELARDLPPAPAPSPTTSRTEDLGERGVLPIIMGGRTHELRTLTLRESRAWKRKLAEAIARLDGELHPSADGADFIGTLLTIGDEERIAILVAYDVEGVLGGRDHIEDTMRAEELAPAVEAVLDAQAPFGEADVPSVVAAFGRPVRVLGGLLSTLVATSARESSPSGPSRPGASPTSTSTSDGPSSSSSSDGPTPSDASSANPASSGT